MLKDDKAFSLAELSIVLIIIGLLVAGVSGGSKLIQQAKLRSLMNEPLARKLTSSFLALKSVFSPNTSFSGSPSSLAPSFLANSPNVIPLFKDTSKNLILLSD